MEVKLLLALAAGLMYWVAWQAIFYDFMEGFLWMPMVHAVVFGLIIGNFQEALLMGAAISAIYVSIVNTGGSVPADCPAAGCIAIPIALMSGMGIAEAVTLAVSVGILGNLIQPIVFNINGMFVHMADRYAAEGDLKKLNRLNYLAMIPCFLLRFPIAFGIVYFGADTIDSMMAILPVWLTNGMNVAGGILPALGIAATLLVINKKQYIPFFLIGYFLVVVFQISILAVAIFGICTVVLYMILAGEEEKELTIAISGGDDDDE